MSRHTIVIWMTRAVVDQVQNKRGLQTALWGSAQGVGIDFIRAVFCIMEVGTAKSIKFRCSWVALPSGADSFLCRGFVCWQLAAEGGRGKRIQGVA